MLPARETCRASSNASVRNDSPHVPRCATGFRILTRLAIALVASATIGCRGLRARHDLDLDHGQYSAEVGPLSLSFFTSFEARVRISVRSSPRQSLIEGRAEFVFPTAEFENFWIHTEGEWIRHGRQLFSEGKIGLDIDDFLRLATDPHLAFRFDHKETVYQLDLESSEALQNFAERVRDARARLEAGLSEDSGGGGAESR
jgi:hypothetical protein